MAEVPYTSKIERPGSSAVSAVYYDNDTNRLYIEFVKQGFAGSIAGYSDVPIDVFNKFAHAESVGKFYNRIFLGYNFEGYDLPVNPEMVDRQKLPPTPDEYDWDDQGEEDYTSDPGVYVVTVVLTVPDCDSPGEAIDAVLRSIKSSTDYSALSATVKPE